MEGIFSPGPARCSSTRLREAPAGLRDAVAWRADVREKGIPAPSRLGARVVLSPASPPVADLVGPTDLPPWDGGAVAGAP